MRRKALLFGNSNGLSGVKTDISNWFSFLTSDIGGAWVSDEIEIMMNPRKTALLSTINSMKGLYDFVIVVFSGHGAYSNRTILEINEKDELVSETDLKGIADRQISVFDCCRGLISNEILNESQNTFNMHKKSFSNIRYQYEKRIMQSIPQQISLYACSIGQSAYDSNNGGYYTKNLLSCAKNPAGNYCLTVGNVHEKAADKTKNEVYEKEKAVQIPDATLPRCLSNQQLILSINPIF